MQYVESVTKGQPDKVCDQIADSLVDEYLRHDPNSRVALEVLGTNGMLTIGGSVSSKADFDVAIFAKKVYRELGYLDELEPFVNISADAVRDSGACIVNGYATSATAQFLPKPIVLAHAIAKRLDDLRESDAEFSWLRPDGQVLVGMEDLKSKAIAINVYRDERADESLVRTRIFERAVAPILGSTDGVRIVINSGVSEAHGGFQSNTGAMGRKLATDTYGGLLPQSADPLSGNDPSNVNRLASYMCRFVAKNLVALGAGRTVLVEAVYIRGDDKPAFLKARTGEGKLIPDVLVNKFDFRAAAILERLDLRKPIYLATSCYGHFGRDGFPWEKIAT